MFLSRRDKFSFFANTEPREKAMKRKKKMSMANRGKQSLMQLKRDSPFYSPSHVTEFITLKVLLHPALLMCLFISPSDSSCLFEGSCSHSSSFPSASCRKIACFCCCLLPYFGYMWLRLLLPGIFFHSNRYT